jgi:hypothetical protein
MKSEICPKTGTTRHERSCYNLVLACTREPHEHVDSCRDDKGKRICGKTLHEHSKTGPPCRVLAGPTCL